MARPTPAPGVGMDFSAYEIALGETTLEPVMHSPTGWED